MSFVAIAAKSLIRDTPDFNVTIILRGKGIVARVRKGGREYTVGLADLNFIAPDPASAERLAMYRYWAGMNEEDQNASRSCQAKDRVSGSVTTEGTSMPPGLGASSSDGIISKTTVSLFQF